MLNVSEPGPRKNLRALLRTWIRATTPDDDAILIVKLGRATKLATLPLLRDLATMTHTIGKSRDEAAPILLINPLLADADMPRLFAAATHYWSMSHGEGWDQPMIEAAATDLRLIAPRHSAYVAYLDDTVAEMIPTGVVPADASTDAWTGQLFAGAEWWEPEENAAADAVTRAVAKRDGPRASPRERVAASFTWEHATTRLLAILDALPC